MGGSPRPETFESHPNETLKTILLRKSCLGSLFDVGLWSLSWVELQPPQTEDIEGWQRWQLEKRRGETNGFAQRGLRAVQLDRVSRN